MTLAVENQVPQAGSNILPTRRIEFDVTGIVKPYQLILSYVDGTEERAWNGIVFSPCFKRDSTRVVQETGGDHFVLYRTGGWRDAPTIIADDGSDLIYLGTIEAEYIQSSSGTMQVLNDENAGLDVSSSDLAVRSAGDIEIVANTRTRFINGIAFNPGNLATSGSVTPSCDAPMIQRIAMTGSVIVNAPINAEQGSRIELYITGGNGVHTLTFDGAIKFGSGAPNAAPNGTPASGKWYHVVLFTPDGSAWRCTSSCEGTV